VVALVFGIFLSKVADSSAAAAKARGKDEDRDGD